MVVVIVRVILPVIADVICIILPGFLPFPAILLPVFPVGRLSPLEILSGVLALSLGFLPPVL
jgi:hypothetical protein